MRYTNKKILKITFPVLVCLLMEQLIGLTDTAYLGRVGEAELGASALAGIFYLMIFMLGFGFSIGAQILIARRNGAKEYSQIGPLFMQSTAFLLLMALVLFILSKVFVARIMGKLPMYGKPPSGTSITGFTVSSSPTSGRCSGHSMSARPARAS